MRDHAHRARPRRRHICSLRGSTRSLRESAMSAKAAFSRLSGSQRIGGRLTRADGGGAIDVIDPATEERVGQVADATAQDVAQAVEVAPGARGSWGQANH